MKNRIFNRFALLTVLLPCSLTGTAQSEIYPRHFDLEEVTLLDGPMKKAMDLNIEVLLQYDVDRLLTPYVRQAGLADKADESSAYYKWLEKHPNFRNWGDASFDLSGHVGGHYLSALALAYAACHDADKKVQLKERMQYMLDVMKDCQDAYDGNDDGLYGFIGGQPINQSWRDFYHGDLNAIRKNWGWVPFYCQHKILAGLRDAYLYGNSEQAKEMFRKMTDWSVNLISNVSDEELQGFLNCEHGGMSESMLDAYQIFNNPLYLIAAQRYTHKGMLDGMQTLNPTFLDGKHANTQVPKYIGMERIGEMTAEGDNYRCAAENFWQDVTENRTVCIGGNSVNEHFLARPNSNRYIDQLDGPESCNSNNMLKLSEMLFDRTGDARYADFYEGTMWNHILSTQDPRTGGYVYFTTLRPQGYRIYSKVNEGMWCCVGTGMENHSKYGHFIYTHDGRNTLFVNLFTPSRLENGHFAITQETRFPEEPRTTLTIGKGGNYTIALRHPAWVGDGFRVSVNGTPVTLTATDDSKPGKASYVSITRKWHKGDRITVELPMTLRYEECPGYGDYIAFKYGPILLAANTTNGTENLRNEYGGEGRMDHAPGSRATAMNLNTAPLLIGQRSSVLDRISKTGDLRFTIDASRPEVASYKWTTLTLQPFWQIHHDRYVCYWYQQTAEGYASSTMAQTEARNEALARRTIDFVAPGEQQSEAGHEYQYSSDSGHGDFHTEHYRDARANGFIQYTLYNNSGEEQGLSLMLRFNRADRGRQAVLTVDGLKLADITIPQRVENADANGFFNVEYPVPAEMAKGKKQMEVRLTASAQTLCPGIYYLRLLKSEH